MGGAKMILQGTSKLSKVQEVEVPQRPTLRKLSSALRRQADSLSVRASPVLLEEATTSSDWLQPGRFVQRGIQQPSTDAKQLEQAFWHHPAVEVPSTREDAIVMMEYLHRETEAQGTAHGTNVVAFTGGHGPALTAYLLDSTFDGAVVGCVGSGVPQEQVHHATYVCDLLGIDLVEVDDQTWGRFDLQCSLGSQPESQDEEPSSVVLFSGATSDTLASHHMHQLPGIQMPLAKLSCAAVNALSRVVGLPQWSPAA